jgi:fimbrial isopeptide formation D2 family protein/LPXTG-motif cell wall-anchored protein
MLKKVLALALAGAMVIGSMSLSAFGAAGDLSVNSTITVGGLDNGDQVTLYKVIGWTGDVKGWDWADGVKSSDAAITNELLKTVVGSKDGAGQITSATASLLAEKANTALVTKETVSGSEWSKSNVEPGLYMVIVTPKVPGTIYNPIFVAANFYGNGETPDSANKFVVESDVKTYYDKGMAKKSTIPLDKTAKGKDQSNVHGNDLANGAYTTDAGEEIDFEITSHVTKFSTAYTNPVFALTDTLTGLALTGDNVKVYKRNDNGTAGAELVKDKDYTITGSAKDSKTYTVTFTNHYLWGDGTEGVTEIPANGQDIIIKYTAKVTDEAEVIVNQENNTVDLIYSTEPSDITGKGRKRDETNHFTFSIDANLLGQDEVEGSSTEAIKVGIDASGNYIVETSYYEWSDEWHGPLDGATFELYKDEACKQLYTNDVFGGTVVSDSTGRITIKGLDAGVYYLKEISAPKGFIKLQDVVKVTITADISENVTITQEVDVDGTKVDVTHTTNTLNWSKVEFENMTTHGKISTSYTITLSPSSAKAIKADREVESSDFELANTKGVELPSTGGIGTTIFYCGGAVLVLLAGVLLVSKRRIA